MKKCTKCLELKELSEFSVRNKSKNTFHSVCKQCVKERDKVAYSNNLLNRKEKIRLNAKLNYDKTTSFIQRVKKFAKCSKCGDSRHYVLDFHHLIDKKKNICNMKFHSIKSVKTEMRKCVILCSNCHREEHYFNNVM
jgi:protein-arginine kinase activator protein McsA